jgi:hypothetical protein
MICSCQRRPRGESGKAETDRTQSGAAPQRCTARSVGETLGNKRSWLRPAGGPTLTDMQSGCSLPCMTSCMRRATTAAERKSAEEQTKDHDRDSDTRRPIDRFVVGAKGGRNLAWPTVFSPETPHPRGGDVGPPALRAAATTSCASASLDSSNAVNLGRQARPAISGVAVVSWPTWPNGGVGVHVAATACAPMGAFHFRR